MLTLFPAFAANGQNTRINLDLKSTPLSEVLQKIEEQCNYTFVYNASSIDVSQKVTVNYNNNTLTEVLSGIGKRHSYGY
ncbi:MAG: hypothetical protein B6I19_10500 [Bacteroidetes bacterium 4572_114]|nr:MAG: hypothetical protein B6I19_10500 [Bacteroidetes bacterium 4572_114]